MDMTADFEEPIEDWQRKLYHGIPGNLICLARSYHAFDEPPQSPGPYVYRAPVHIFPVGKQHRITKEYEGICDQIRDVCDTMNWRAIGVYRLGWRRKPQDNPVVIFVRVRNGGATINTAKKVVAEIGNILSHADMRDVHVHVAGEPRAQHEDEDEPPPNLERCYNMSPTIGVSLAPRGAKHSGTLGLYVRITNKERLVCHSAITCHHVVEPDNRETPFAPYVMDSVETQSDLKVTCPSVVDHGILVRDYQDQCKALRRYLERLRAKEALAQDGVPELWTSHLEQEKTRLTSELADKEGRLADLMDFFSENSTLGEVVASSGIQQPEPHHGVSNWALIRLDGRRFPSTNPVKNRLPHDATLEFKRILYILGQREEDSNPDFPCGVFENLLRGNRTISVPRRTLRDVFEQRIGTEVFLYGRSSGATVGLLNEIRDYVRTLYRSASGISRVVVSREFVVVDPARLGLQFRHSPNYIPPFSASGDSGASVFNEDGDIVGMSFAGNPSDPCGFSTAWVTPIESTITDIERHLNGNVFGGSSNGGDWKVEIL